MEGVCNIQRDSTQKEKKPKSLVWVTGVWCLCATAVVGGRPGARARPQDTNGGAKGRPTRARADHRPVVHSQECKTHGPSQLASSEQRQSSKGNKRRQATEAHSPRQTKRRDTLSPSRVRVRAHTRRATHTHTHTRPQMHTHKQRITAAGWWGLVVHSARRVRARQRRLRCFFVGGGRGGRKRASHVTCFSPTCSRRGACGKAARRARAAAARSCPCTCRRCSP